MRMRFQIIVLTAACLLPAAASFAPAAPPAPAPSVSPAPADPDNLAEFTVRGTGLAAGSDEGRFMRYQDLRNGGTVDLLRFTKDTGTSLFNVQADHVGYRDQRFSAAVNNFGRLKASFEFNQVPLYFSADTKSIFSPSAANPNQLRIDDSIQTGLQNKTLAYASVDGLASPFDLQLKRSIADFKATYSATRTLDINIALKSTAKTGDQPWAGTFGFSDAVELAVPVQTRTTDLGLGLEWGNDRGSARVGYDGSFFRNDVQTLVWDNPLRVTDSPTAGPLQGRESLWPNSNQNTGSLSGLLNLPGRSRATAYLSVGNWSQDNPLIPFTVNSTIAPIALDRTTSDAQARVTSMNYSFFTRPVNDLSLTLRYRSYDFDNRTPIFHVNNTVAYDTTVEAFTEGGSSPYSLNRKTFDADLSYTPLRYSAFRVGYTREDDNETFRTFSSTAQDTARVSADVSGINWLVLRGVFEYSNRTGSGLDEQALDDIGEQVSLRQFDISDFTSKRVSFVTQVTPISSLSFNGTVSVGTEDRPGTVFGLVSDDSHAYQAGVDYVPTKAISMGASYEWERYTSLQQSREANPGAQFDDPTRNWTTSGADKAQTFNASMDLLKALPKTDIRVAYDYSDANSLYLYGLPANTTIAPVVQLPAVVNTRQRGTVDLRYHFTARVSAGIVYWYDKYAVNDFAMGTQTLTTIAQPSFLTIGYLDRPYTANTVSGRFTYFW